MTERNPTGIEHFDRELGGGLPAGSIIGLVTPPASQGELLLKTIAQHRETIYVTTTRTADAVEAWLQTNDADEAAADIDVAYGGVDSFRPSNDDALREWISMANGENGEDRLQKPRVNVANQLDGVLSALTANGKEVAIIDPINPLETVDESMFMAFLHEVQDHLLDTGNVALLHMAETQQTPQCRWISLQMADQVWDLSVEVPNERVEFLLTISKSRSGEVPNRRIKFQLTDDVAIDTSRDIA